MPLHRFDDSFEYEGFQYVQFPMIDPKGARIVYQVSYAALQDRASADGDGSMDAVASFLRNREKIEQIASRKYDAGDKSGVRTHELTPLG
jgi:hypothetical protein